MTARAPREHAAVDARTPGRRGSRPTGREPRPLPAFLTKGRGVFSLMLLTALTLLAGTQTWIRVKLPEAGVQQEILTVSGADASKPVTALVVVALAAAVAAAVGGRITRIVSLVMVFGSMALAAVLSAFVANGPLMAASAKIAETIGIEGSSSGAEATATMWPVVAAVLAGLAALYAAALGVVSPRWETTAKYSAGADGQPGRAGAEGPRRVSAQSEAIDAWDDLTRGEDPTAR
ncbi:Trp biosynthesis-associated membrane protein [Falsarthrobacter nasiphocae]|uniref:Membrane protein (TIGR02234 family) n=1 Tax=Falsarthrobacter nasiphocae TaxID=189863 RepID=A0AAE3YFI9_9MICC|nr:Trp biosynthesis-associated membrane protein [Falsarthrobacter nasiphocae]MDR6891229.1 putative membrane protein (TIGR02234 family) [Falsarthrobacter nasiphocae]